VLAWARGQRTADSEVALPLPDGMVIEGQLNGAAPSARIVEHRMIPLRGLRSTITLPGLRATRLESCRAGQVE
jgi:hypothetical protein